MERYHCGNCGRAIPKNVGVCPHCGVYLSGVKRVKQEKNVEPMSGRVALGSLLFSIVLAICIASINNQLTEPILGCIIMLLFIAVPVWLVSAYIMNFFDEFGFVGWIIAIGIILLIVHFAIFFISGNMGFIL